MFELRTDSFRGETGRTVERVGIYEGDTRMSWATLTGTSSRLGGHLVPTLCIGGVGSAPEYRRGGNVRRIFDYAFEKSAGEPWAVAMLHPFSFNYYRKFGFERVCDHRIVTVPMTALSHLPRFSEFHPMKESDIPAILALYGRFSEPRNCTLTRTEAAFRIDSAPGTPFFYAWYKDGVPKAYLKLSTKKKMLTNHMGEGVLTVHEIAFDDPEGLYAALGFLRMYEGELETVVFENIAHIPEMGCAMTEYIAEKIELVPDIAARVLDTKAVLCANIYPQKAGRFTVRVDDTLIKVRGTFRVDYENGAAEVRRLDDGAAFDLRADAAAFTRLVYGAESMNAALAAYLPGVTLNNDAEDFFRAFPKRACGLFEHF
ncbi:MAG: GNAT family N-acetyltransferase [Clostridiaceae bacterium]|nr:GNAT family N-acetyltransferase [Clostridiaceae bacterium]